MPALRKRMRHASEPRCCSTRRNPSNTMSVVLSLRNSSASCKSLQAADVPSGGSPSRSISKQSSSSSPPLGTVVWAPTLFAEPADKGWTNCDQDEQEI